MLSLLLGAYLLQATYIDLFNDGHRLLDQGKPREAEAVLIKSASLNPSHVPTLKDLGESYVLQKRLPEAIDQYHRIIELNPKDITAWGRLAELYSWAGNNDKSIVTYKDALQLDPKNVGLKNGLATVLRWSHRHDEAERYFREVLSQEPESHDALKGLAKTYSMKGDLPSAVESFEKAIRIYPHDAELHKELGTVFAWQKEYSKAINSLRKAIELSPSYPEAYRTLGDVYSWMKSYKPSIEAYRKAAELEPNNIDNHLFLASMHRMVNDNQRAEESIKTALRIDPSDARALQMLRDLRGEGSYYRLKTIGEVLEGTAFVLVLGIILYVSRAKKRMLRRKHKAYTYFMNVAVPFLVAVTFTWYLGKDYFSQYVNVSFVEELTEAVLFIALGISFLVLLWTDHRSREFTKKSILIVGAHPDDVELGCGGFILKAKDSGASVYGLTLTKGERGTDRTGIRELELKRAAAFMELDGVWVMDFPDTQLRDHVDAIKDVIEEKIKETGASMVFTHTPIDMHPDHVAVFEASKIAGRNISVVCYEDVSTPREFVPNYFIDVTSYIDDKMKMITFHKTQEDKNYMDPEVVKGRAAHRGIQCGVQYAEAFRIYKLLR